MLLAPIYIVCRNVAFQKISTKEVMSAKLATTLFMWLLPMFTVCGTQREIYAKLIIVKFILKASRGSLSCNRSVKAGIVRVTPDYKKKTQVEIYLNCHGV